MLNKNQELEDRMKAFSQDSKMIVDGVNSKEWSKKEILLIAFIFSVKQMAKLIHYS